MRKIARLQFNRLDRRGQFDTQMARRSRASTYNFEQGVTFNSRIGNQARCLGILLRHGSFNRLGDAVCSTSDLMPRTSASGNHV